MTLQGRTALVTGSTSGIGAACVEALARQGAAIVVNGFGDADTIAAQCAALSALSGTEAIYLNADLSDGDATQALAADALARFGRVDILVNNAGIQHVCPVDEFPIEKWRQMHAIMVEAPFILSRAFVPGMKAQEWGRIIAIASAHGTTASPNKSAYVTAKHASIGMTRALAIELATCGITANAVSPGYVWTPLVENQIPDTMRTRGMTREQVMNDVLLASTPQKRFVTPDQVGAMVAYLCSEAASTITGANQTIDGGWTAQ
jgi:3-hydroxybutyrate dehydrogenase